MSPHLEEFLVDVICACNVSDESGSLLPLSEELSPLLGLLPCCSPQPSLRLIRTPSRRRTVGAPYAIVPPDSTLRYEVELLRLSSRGPDALTEGIARCGAGGAGATTEKCDQIDIAEFI